jgi:hypothetical protein
MMCDANTIYDFYSRDILNLSKTIAMEIDKKYQFETSEKLEYIYNRIYSEMNKRSLEIRDTIKILTLSQAKDETGLWTNLHQYITTSTAANRIRSCVSEDYSKILENMIQSRKYGNGDNPIPALAFGNKYEDHVLELFGKQMSELHENFIYERRGLCLFRENAFIGASPDGITQCKCCGIGAIEIKCSYYAYTNAISIRNEKELYDHVNNPIYKNSPITKIFKKKTWPVVINTKHAYFTQMAMEMISINAEFCWFCLYTANDSVYIMKINRNHEFESMLAPKLVRYVKKYLIPNILERSVKSKVSL